MSAIYRNLPGHAVPPGAENHDESYKTLREQAGLTKPSLDESPRLTSDWGDRSKLLGFVGVIARMTPYPEVDDDASATMNLLIAWARELLE